MTRLSMATIFKGRISHSSKQIDSLRSYDVNEKEYRIPDSHNIYIISTLLACINKKAEVISQGGNELGQTKINTFTLSDNISHHIYIMFTEIGANS